MKGDDLLTAGTLDSRHESSAEETNAGPRDGSPQAGHTLTFSSDRSA